MEYPINTKETTLHERKRTLHEKIANLSYNFQWPELINVLKENESAVNFCRLSTSERKSKLFTPLHQAAFGLADISIVRELINMQASRTLKTNERKETAYDIAVRKNAPEEILQLLKVPDKIMKNSQIIENMEMGLHKVILERAKDLVEENQLQLPQLGFLYEFGSFWFPVPGMYGGFNVEECELGIHASSWCRVVGGSGQKHLIDKEGNVTLIEEGFV